MSSSFSGLQPVSIPFSGAADSSGNFTLNLRPRAAFWCHLKMAAEVSAGFPIWKVTTGAGPVGYHLGPLAEVAPILVAPGDQITISLTGANPLATIKGQLLGAQAPTAVEAMSYNPAVSTISIDAGQPRSLLYPDGVTVLSGPSFTVPAAVNTNATFTLPARTTDIRIGSVVSGGATTTFTTAIFVVGIQTGIRYFPKAGTGQPFGSRQPITIPVDIEQDKQVQVQVSPDGTHALDVYVSAITGIEAIEIYAQEPIPVTLGSIAGPTSIPVPAPQWQAQAHVGVNSPSPASVASPTPGAVRALVYEVVFSLAANAVARIFNGRVWDGASGGTLIGICTLGNGTGAQSVALHRLVSSAGNVLTFDFDFTTAGGEQQSITASGDFVT